MDLTTRVKVEDAAIPSLLQRCIQYIEDSGKRNIRALYPVYMYMYMQLGPDFSGLIMTQLM